MAVPLRRRMKQRGTRFEYRVRDYLRELGWTVFRSAGSQTCADLIGIKPGPRVVLVQCKAMDNPSLSPEEKRDLIAHASELGVKVLVISRALGTHKLVFHALVNQRFRRVARPKWLL